MCLSGSVELEHSAPDQVRRVLGNSNIKIRKLEARDRAAILTLCRTAYSEIAGADKHLAQARVDRGFDHALSEQNGDLCLVAVRGHDAAEQLVGFLYAVAAEDFFSEDVMVSCQAYYVEPASRHTVASFLLLRSLMRRALNGGANKIGVRVTSGIRIEQTHRFLSKMGFRHMGGTYEFSAEKLRPSQTS